MARKPGKNIPQGTLELSLLYILPPQWSFVSSHNQATLMWTTEWIHLHQMEPSTKAYIGLLIIAFYNYQQTISLYIISFATTNILFPSIYHHRSNQTIDACLVIDVPMTGQVSHIHLLTYQMHTPIALKKCYTSTYQKATYNIQVSAPTNVALPNILA